MAKTNEVLMPLDEWRETRFTRAPDPRTARKWCERGEVPSKKIGSRWFVRIEAEAKQTGEAKVDKLINRVLEA